MTDSEKLREIQRIVSATVMTINMLPFMKDEAAAMGFEQVRKACELHQEGKTYEKELEKEIRNL